MRLARGNNKQYAQPSPTNLSPNHHHRRPNGAGKTTFAKEFLRHEANCQTFINADLIASGLSPFAPELAAIQAGKLMLAAIDQQVILKETFAFETTLSGRAYALKIPFWQAAGYRVKLIFVQLASADIAVSRVRGRVQQGGHHIEEPVVRRRFDLGLLNYATIYRRLVDEWALYDNTQGFFQLIETGEHK